MSRQATIHEPSAEPSVEFRDVCKTYDGENLVVDTLNLSVRTGEFLTLLGPSGSGKSTTLMMLAGMEDPTSGQILLDGNPISSLPPHKREFGMVFQSYALFPHMTVLENIEFPLRQRRFEKDTRQVKSMAALDMFQITDLSNRFPAQLSGGQQQRVALARALVFDPALILMDEPLGALDKKLRETMRREIRDIHKKTGVTVVYVTHDQIEALTMSDRIAIFRDGVIRQIDNPRNLYEMPNSRFVANFLGDNNVVAGESVSINGDRACFKVGDGTKVNARIASTATGAETCMCIRPESIRVGRTAISQEISFRSTVIDVDYHGDYELVSLVLPWGDHVNAKVSPDSNDEKLTVGVETNVGWSSEQAVVVANE